MPALLPSLKQAVRLPEGVSELEQINSALSRLLTDSDRDICAATRSVQGQFKAMPVRLTGIGVLGARHGAGRCAQIWWPFGLNLQV
jgi:hypothetical protein